MIVEKVNRKERIKRFQNGSLAVYLKISEQKITEGDLCEFLQFNKLFN